MSEQNSEKPWDEFKWERFLQEQERRTEKYMELNDQYRDHPNRDEIIAKEMGWQHLIGGESRDWDEAVDAAFDEQDDAGQDTSLHGFERNPIYMKALAFNGRIDDLYDSLDEKTREHPAMISLENHVTVATSKLAAALNDDYVEELGMSIAYIKRSLASLNLALDAALNLMEGGFVNEETFVQLRTGIFDIRDDVVATVGAYRAEFRRRNGGR